MTRYPLTVFFDGDCPICAREIAFIKRLNRKQLLRFCDFSLPEFDEQRMGFPRAKLGEVIHAQWGDGSVIRGVAVFQAIWEAAGLGLLAKISRLSFIEPLFFKAYAWFARNRLWLTGRSSACAGAACRSAHSSRHSP